jgi:serine/threonine-protein kinase
MSEQPEPKPAASPSIKQLSGRIGKYDIVKPLGKGAMGMVYLAHDTVLERDVALKVMVAQIADDPELNQRFIREAKAVAKMTHPNVVAVFDLGNHSDGSPFIAMELLKGQDLQKAMRAQPPMSLERKVAVIVQVLAGLAHAHQAGIVHRDIKPANIFINNDGTVKIMDFGVARLTTASMTGTGNIVGTADYMSPEQVKGAKVDGRSDLFSVGCMLFELLAGRRPFHAENLMAIFYKITHEEPDWSLLQGEKFEPLLPVLQRALSKNLDERYATAYDFAIELRDYLKAHSTSVSGQHALESLLELEAPTSPPQPLTDVPSTTLVTADELGSGAVAGRPSTARSRPGTGRPGAPTQPGAPTHPGTQAQTVVTGAGISRGAAARPATSTRPGTFAPTLRPGTTQMASTPTVVRTPTAVRPGPREAEPSRAGHPVLYAVLGAMAVALLGTGGYIVSQRSASVSPSTAPASAAPPQSAPSAPPVTQAAAPTAPALPPPTAAPPPTFAEARGKGATAMKNAQAAFKSRDYDRAIAQAQTALAEDPDSADAKRLVESALNGQRADARFRAAEAALRQNDYARAASEAEAGRAAAPWDSRGTDLLGRIQQAQANAQAQASAQAQQQRAAQLAAQTNTLLGQADNALSSQNYDGAIGLYDEVLKLDPQNQRAAMGRTNAVGARAVAQAAASAGSRGGPAGRSFVAAKTVAQSIETKATGSVPEGFEDTPGVTVKRGSQAAELPGKLHFDVDPESVKPGDKYNVKVYLVNEGAAPIQVTEMIVSTKINGRGASGPVPPLTKDVAPRQRTLLREFPDFWKEDTTSWSMEVMVRTARGETYKNQVSWK